MTGSPLLVPLQSPGLKDRSSVKDRYQTQWERALTSDEVGPQFALSKIVGPDVAVNRTGHNVSWTDMEGLYRVFCLVQRLDCLTALCS